MFFPLSLFIGLRYTRAKRKNHFISFIAGTSMLGIALGVTVLITVLSVMNGFDEEIHQRFFGLAPEVTVNAYQGVITDWPHWQAEARQVPKVRAVAPVVGGQGLLTHLGLVEPVVLSGILPAEEVSVSTLADSMVDGHLTDLTPGGYGIILGQQLANQLNIIRGDKVTVMVPQASVTPAGLIPRFKRFTVVGVFSVGTGFHFDNRLAFIHFKDAQALYQLRHDQASSLKVRIDDVYRAPAVSSAIADRLPYDYYASNWTQQYGAFFQTIKLEKTMMFLILVLIIAVAAFNLVSSLVMVVNDKRADIAILRTMGALPKTIMRVFMLQGVLIGLIGVILGVVGGLLLASYVTEVVNVLQNVLGVQLLSANIYFVDYLPSKILFSDILHVCMIALVLSFLATLYPAWRASRIQPAEALRYD